MLSEGTSSAEAIIPLIICTTIHAQDFRDSVGDRIKGRSTLPILFPRGSRWLLFASILGWSVVLAERASGVHYATKVTYVIIGIFVGALFVLQGEGEQDQQSYDAYNVRDSTVTVSRIQLISNCCRSGCVLRKQSRYACRIRITISIIDNVLFFPSAYYSAYNEVHAHLRNHYLQSETKKFTDHLFISE